MSQEFRLRFDQMQENKQPEDQPVADHSVESMESYTTPSGARNICFGWPDGKRLFLNYSYLVSGEYAPEQNEIFLQFTSHHVMIAGARLEILYDSIMHQMAKLVSSRDTRYETFDDTDKPVIQAITAVKLDT